MSYDIHPRFEGLRYELLNRESVNKPRNRRVFIYKLVAKGCTHAYFRLESKLNGLPARCLNEILSLDYLG